MSKSSSDLCAPTPDFQRRLAPVSLGPNRLLKPARAHERFFNVVRAHLLQASPLSQNFIYNTLVRSATCGRAPGVKPVV